MKKQASIALHVASAIEFKHSRNPVLIHQFIKLLNVIGVFKLHVNLAVNYNYMLHLKVTHGMENVLV